MSGNEKKSGINKKAEVLQLVPKSSNPPEASDQPFPSPEPKAAKQTKQSGLISDVAKELTPTPDTANSLKGKFSVDRVLTEKTSSRAAQSFRLTEEERFGQSKQVASGELDDLLGTDIESRRGNYVFTVGRPASGKSTLQSHLTRYLYQSGDYIPTPIKTHDEMAAQQAVSREVLQEWQRRWLVNRFPERTVSKHPSEYRFHMTPEKRRNRPLEFGYFEVAGEVYRQLLAAGASQPDLPESLYQFLSNKKCKFLFLFVCIGHEIDQDDLVFCAFLDYLHFKFGERFMENSHIGIVISDPTSAVELLKKRRSDSGRSGKLDKQGFASEFLPTTTARLKGWNNDFALAQFHVGDVVLDDELNEPVIENPSFVDAKLVFNWMYQCFEGVAPEPGPTMLQRAQKWLAQFAE